MPAVHASCSSRHLLRPVPPFRPSPLHTQAANKALILMDLRHNQLSPAWCQELLGLASVGQSRVFQL